MSTIRNLIIGMAAVGLALAAPAAVVLEFDYQNVNNGTHQVNATQARSGASFVAVLTTNTAGVFSTVNTGVALGGGPIIPQLQNGYLEAVGNDGRGASMLNTGGVNNQWQDYVGVPSFGTNTIEIVFRPNISGNFLGRETFFAHSVAGGGEVFFYTQDGINPTNAPLTLRLKASAAATVNLAAPTWNSNTWYYLATSWAVGQVQTIYWRELKSSTGALDPYDAGHFAANGNALTEGTDFIQEPHMGVWGHVGGTDNENMRGDMAFLRWTDQYTANAAGFDLLFDSLFIPEPGTVFLMLGGAAVLRIARRRLAVR